MLLIQNHEGPKIGAWRELGDEMRMPQIPTEAERHPKFMKAARLNS